ncbi:phytanoyl-CoA dioxygenase family protein [Roseovarius indicus]|uniref:Ectoine hydroxylase n=1 Tax=Roseovarius indicus TaxID=540747 RepID=A0A0T5PDA8_9RHOB|nr:phytanoyl-CoA dioxygenase family protein [Roseovarius indicus]KRS19018.1 phytanoyl-CoA dioxygenase [Roseovarius indicus]QEW26042.1 ectoine hydroxylase [Roseovarius indicus]SFD92266.1 Ectoine hydroxylase-related dioxygenase, phytanoyl-CoA dioxygenase (PhyH) family [Roseovarius indicus]
MLSDAQRAFYAENGYLMIENAVTPDQLDRLRAITARLIDASRTVSESNDVYDLDKGHGPDSPRLTRIKIPHKQDPYFWEVLRHSTMTQVLNDLLGPDTTILTSKLNTKAPGGGRAVEWHQDWAFYPHTNDDLLAFGLMLEDVDEANGPLMVIPGTHRGPVLDHTSNGVFAGAINPDDPAFDREKIVTLTGKAGSMTVHHARLLHGSAPNRSDRARMILFYECASADAWPILGSNSYFHALGQRKFWDDLQDRTITGTPCLTPRLEQVPVTMPLPPAPDTGSIFRTQESAGARSAFAED